MELNKNEYELIKDNGGFDYDALKERYTEYFDEYDYILGDWAYGKLRLKGFCDKTNKKFKPLNDIKMIDKYVLDNGAYGCKYFIIKKQ